MKVNKLLNIRKQPHPTMTLLIPAMPGLLLTQRQQERLRMHKDAVFDLGMSDIRGVSALVFEG